MLTTHACGLATRMCSISVQSRCPWQWGRPALGFAHLDLEGHERAALLGMRSTMGRSRPVISTEAKMARPEARALLQLLEAHAYVSFVVQEQCGTSPSCRNILNFPEERVPLLLRSPTLDLAVRASFLARVNSSTVSRFARSRERLPTSYWSCREKWFCIARFSNLVPWRIFEQHGTASEMRKPGESALRIGLCEDMDSEECRRLAPTFESVKPPKDWRARLRGLRRRTRAETRR